MEGLRELLAMLSWSWIAMLFIPILAGLWSFTYILQHAFMKSKHLPPGPRGLPLIGHLHMLGDLPHRNLQKLSQKYGPIMQLRLGLVPTVVVSSPEVAELFLKTHDLNFASRPKLQAAEYLSYGQKGVAFSQYGSYWRDMRKLCTIHLLNMSKIDSFMSLRKEEVTELVETLKGPAERREVVNISTQVGSAIETLTYRMIFGKGFKEKSNFKSSIEEALQLIGGFNMADYVPFMRQFDIQGLKRRLTDVSNRIDVFLEKNIDEHKENMAVEGHHMDFIDTMLSTMESNNADDEKVNRTNIKAVTLDLLIAAMDTTSTTVEWTLTEILRHPHVMKRIQEELMNVVGMDRMVEERDLGKLTYLNMVVKEAMRLHTAGPLLVPREAIDDITINGYHIAKHSRIIINAWAIARDPNAWSDAEEFYPERFKDSSIDLRGRDIQLIPFGSGRRVCPGIELGLRTVQLVLAQLVHCYNLELPVGTSPGDIDMEEKFGLAVKKACPLLVVPSYRLKLN